MLALPWALKFLWAPAVDRWGTRRAWIIPLQLLTVGTLIILALISEAGSPTILMGAVLVLNLLAATQDIATDGLAVDLLEPHERGFANGLQVAGYRAGMIVGGGALLIAHDQLGPSMTYLAMAALTALATLPIAASRTHPTPESASLERRPSVLQFLRRPNALRICTIIFCYKAGDAFASGMLRPFLADLGLSMSDVGWLLGTVGFVAGLLGALAGGVLVNRVGRRNSLMIFGTLEAVTIFGYALLASQNAVHIHLYVLCAVEHFSGGMATAALFTCMMDWSSAGSGATDYTVQASFVVIATGVASALAGFSAQALGYSWHFFVSAVLAFASVLVVARCFPSVNISQQWEHPRA
jgi:predicted MFS family arabinose efflux permease